MRQERIGSNPMACSLDGIELSSLRQIEHTVTCSPIGSGPGSCLLEYADHVIAATLCKRGELGHLSLTRLVCGRDSGVNGGTLSQLNPLGFWPCKPLILLVRELS